MPSVQLSDGRTVEFPDGMTQDAMAAALKQLPPMSGPTPVNEPAMLANAAGKGLAHTAGLPGTFLNLMAEYLTTPVLNKASKAVGGPDIPYVPLQIDGRGIENALTQAGVLNRPGTKPETTGQKYAAAAAEGVGGAVPFAPLMRGAGKLLSLVAQGAGSGAGMEYGRQATEGRGPAWSAFGQIGGAIAGGVGAGGIANAAARGVNAARGIGNEVTAAYDRLGIKPRMVADVTGSPRQARWTDASGGGSGGGKILREARTAQDDFADAVERATANAAPTPQSAGKAIQDGAASWFKNWRQQSDQSWSDFFRMVPGKAQIPVTNFRTAIDDVLKDFGDARNLADVLQPGPTRAVSRALAADTALPAPPAARPSSLVSETGSPIMIEPSNQEIAQYLARLQRGERLEFSALKAIRSRLGEMLEGGQLVDGMPVANVKRLYGALTKDLRAGAEQIRPGAGKAFDAANAVTREGHDLIETTVGNLINRVNPDLISPEQAFNWTMQQVKAGDTRLGNVRGVVGPGTFESVAQTQLREMARPGAQAASEISGGPRASQGRFNSQWNQLSPEGRSMLFEQIPQAEDLATVAGRAQATASLANTSRTASGAQDLATLQGLAGLVGGGVGLGTGSTTAGIGAAGSALLTPIVSRYLLAQALSGPKSARLAAAPNLDGMSAMDRAMIAAILSASKQGDQPNGP